MSIETEMSSDVAWLQAKVRQLETNAVSIWAHYETYVLAGVFLIVGIAIGIAIGHKT